MRRSLLVVAVLAAAAMPTVGRTEIRDGKDCRNSEGTTAFADSGVIEEPGNVENADRGAYCVRANGMTVFYLGGEAQPENPQNAGFGGLCGVLIVGDTSYGSGHEDANTDPDDWNWQHRHPGPDGTLNTEDDVIHKHDCN